MRWEAGVFGERVLRALLALSVEALGARTLPACLTALYCVMLYDMV